MILLGDEEIEQLIGVEFKTAYSGHVEEYRSIAKAQLKKVAEIIKRDCPETLFLLEDLKFWQTLLKEVEGG